MSASFGNWDRSKVLVKFRLSWFTSSLTLPARDSIYLISVSGAVMPVFFPGFFDKKTSHADIFDTP